MGKISGDKGRITLGPWGGKGGKVWAYKPDGPIMQITIWYQDSIDQILFESKSSDGVVIGDSVKIGKPGFPCQLETFCIDSSVEQLLSISLTYECYYERVGIVITSLCLETNIGNKYGPKYGPFTRRRGPSVSILVEGGVIITGFHGRGGRYLDAIGIFVAPKLNSLPSSEKKVDSLHPIQDPDSAPTQLKGKISGEEGWISLGPWGGEDGVNWAYKADGPIMQISISYGLAIDSILIESKSCDGVVIGSSKKFGGTGGHLTETFCLNTLEEQLLSISLSYEDFYGKVTIISLCFNTNLKKYGPFGSRMGASSLSIPFPIEGGVVCGLHGRIGAHLFAIGILVAPKFKSLHSIPDPDLAPTQFKVLGSAVSSKHKKHKEIIHNAASSSSTTNKDEIHGGAPSPSFEMIRNHLLLVKEYMNHMNVQVNLASEKFEELQKLGSNGRDFDELGKVIAKLKCQIPLTTNKEDHHDGPLSPISKLIRSDLILVDTAFAEAKESMCHMNVEINRAHEKFKELQISQTSEGDSDELLKADFAKKRKAKSDELRKAIGKLKVKIPSHNKIRSVDSNLHRKNWDNINRAEEGMMHFFHKEPEVAHSTGDCDGILEAFHDLPMPLRDCLLCFFKFPPMATIKRTLMIYQWIGQRYISRLLNSDGMLKCMLAISKNLFGARQL